MANSGPLAFSVSGPSALDFSVDSGTQLSFGVAGVSVVYQALPEYDGPVVITPGAEEQVLATTGKSVYSDIVIGAIPQNYGLVTWNGSTLTVS